jgi:amidase
VCGLVGLKPTRGRSSLGPEAGEAWSGLVSRLVVTRSVRDTAGVLAAAAGTMPGDPYTAPPPSRPYPDEVGAEVGRLRIGWSVTCPDPAVAVDPEVAAAVEAAAALLADLGHHVDAAHPQVWDDEEAMGELTGHFINGMAVWTAAELDRLAGLAGAPFPEDGVEPHTAALAEMGRAVTGLQLHATIAAVHGAGRALAEFWADPDDGIAVGLGVPGRGYDVLVTPVIPELPWTLGQFGATADNPLHGLGRAAAVVPFTVPFNISGQPAVSLPLGWSGSGLPIGVQLVADHGREDLLLRLAAQVEAAAPWSDRRPPVHA